MQRYWSSLRYSFLRTLFLLAAEFFGIQHPPTRTQFLVLCWCGLSRAGFLSFPAPFHCVFLLVNLQASWGYPSPLYCLIHRSLPLALASLTRFQKFGCVNPFRAGAFSDLGYGFGLLLVKSSPGVTPKPRFGPNLDSTVLTYISAAGSRRCIWTLCSSGCAVKRLGLTLNPYPGGGGLPCMVDAYQYRVCFVYVG